MMSSTRTVIDRIRVPGPELFKNAAARAAHGAKRLSENGFKVELIKQTMEPAVGDRGAAAMTRPDNQGAHEKMSDYFFTNAPGRTRLISDIAKWFHQVVYSERDST